MPDALGAVHDWATSLDLEVTPSADGFVVTMPGTARREVPVAITATAQALVFECFVARGTDEDPRRLHAFLLQRNRRAFGAAYAIDAHGDVYLIGRLPLASADATGIDLVMASILGMADGDFNTILELAYPEAIAREWRWRLARGESIENLRAFEHLRPRDV